jgi:hypothetical protein
MGITMSTFLNLPEIRIEMGIDTKLNQIICGRLKEMSAKCYIA